MMMKKAVVGANFVCGIGNAMVISGCLHYCCEKVFVHYGQLWLQ